MFLYALLLLPLPTGPYTVERTAAHWTDAKRDMQVDIWYPTGPKVPKRLPILIFSHGGGMKKDNYTGQFTDLASHGYVVASVPHPARNWPRPSEEANLDQLQWLAEDILFVRDNLGRDTTLPFARHLDRSRVGAFGHSLGGQAAARACQIDRRIRACLNQDGLSRFAPFYVDSRGWGMHQSFMLIARAPRNDKPTDQEVAAMNMSRAELDQLVASLKARQEAALKATGGGSYHVLLDRIQTTHIDFSDLPIQQARTAEEAALRTRVMATIRAYTRAFFDEKVRGVRSPLLHGGAPLEFVDAIQRFQRR